MKKITAIIICVLIIFSAFPPTVTDTSAAFVGSDKVTIVIDPGHGGGSVGTSARGVGEKTYTLKLANLIYDKLVANGNFNVYMTRTGDYDLELYQRAEIANNHNADLLLSIHFDGSTASSMNGVTAYTSIFDEYAATSLSGAIAQKISAATGLKNNGVSRRADNQGYYWNTQKQWDCQDSSLGILSDYYGIPTWAAKFGMKSIIVEHGYFSNNHDVNIIFAEGTLEKMAQAEVDAIISYYTNHTHVYSAAKQDFPSNCMYTGKMSEKCSVCGHRRNVQNLAPAPTNHYWVTKENSPASCGHDGKLVLECRITQNLKDKGWDGEIHTSVETIPAPMDHTYELVKDVKATHTVDGYQTWKCKTCSSSFTETTKAEGHTFEFESYTAPTCTEDGGNTYKCTACGDTYTDKEPAVGHSYTVIEKIEPTCTEKGKQDKECSVCAIKATDEFEPLGHTLPENSTTPPTCTADGSRKGNCLRCSIEIEEVIEKTGHIFVNTVNTAPTCTEAGNVTKACSVCGYTEEELTEATGHSFERTVTENATCEKDGTATLTCTVCKATETEVIKAIGHKQGKKISQKNATAFSAGAVEYSCENGCGKVFKNELPPTAGENAKLIAVAGAAFVLVAIIAAVVIIIMRKRIPDLSPEEAAAEAQTAEAEDKSEKEEEASEESEKSEESEEYETKSEEKV